MKIDLIKLTVENVKLWGFEIIAHEKDHSTLEKNGVEIENYWLSGKWGNFYYGKNYEISLSTNGDLYILYKLLTGEELFELPNPVQSLINEYKGKLDEEIKTASSYFTNYEAGSYDASVVLYNQFITKLEGVK